MSRASAVRAKPVAAARRSPRRSGAGGTLLGVFIGLVLGLALAAAVAFYVTGGWRSYQAQFGKGEAAKDASKDATRSAKSDEGGKRFDFYKILPGQEEPKVQPGARPAEKPVDRATTERAANPDAAKAAAETAAADKAAADKAAAEKAAAPTAAQAPERTTVAKAAPEAPKAAGDRFWLQAGSFANEADAENLKARLALAGWEASVQQGTVPDLGLRYRVRLGPYENTDEINRIKGELSRRGFDVKVMRQ